MGAGNISRQVSTALLATLIVAAPFVIYHGGIKHYLLDAAAHSQVDYVCRSLSRQAISRADLCSRPIPEIPALREHWQRILDQDAEWFATRGFKPYPLVDCSDNGMVLQFLNQRFSCEGEKGQVRDAE